MEQQHLLVSIIYFIITVLFSWNLKKLYTKYVEGKIPASNILATVSLVVTFLALSIFFLFNHIQVVVGAQIYLLLTMLYIKFFSKK